MYDQTVPFYLGRTTRLVDFRDELALGHRRRAGEADSDDRGLDRRVARRSGRAMR